MLDFVLALPLFAVMVVGADVMEWDAEEEAVRPMTSRALSLVRRPAIEP
jgi:hypothetical protein